MTGQVHITHRSDYLRGREDGHRAALAGAGYRPRDGATGTEDQQRAYSQGYGDGYAESHPCETGTCDHLAHRNAAGS